MPKNIYTTHHYTYLITNITNGIKYIGVRTCNCTPEEDNEYWGSSKHLKEAINEEGISNFKKDILFEYSTRVDASSEEIRLHELYDVGRNTEFYNKCKATSIKWDTTGVPCREETKRKISDANKGMIRSEEFKLNLSKINTGRVMGPVPEERKRKISKTLTGTKATNEARLNMSKAQTGRKHSEETKLHMSLWRMGIKYSKETINKMSIAKRNMSKETKLKISECKKGKNNPKWLGYYITPLGTFILSSEAADIVGISHPSLRIWCKEGKILSKQNINSCKCLDYSSIGKSTKDVGFGFIPK